MAANAGIYTPDYQGSQDTKFVGTIATTANTGVITLGAYRIFKVVFSVQPIAATPAILRFTMGNSAGTAAPTPTSASPFLYASVDNVFMCNVAYNQINFANLAADNGAVTIAYSIIPLAKS